MQNEKIGVECRLIVHDEEMGEEFPFLFLDRFYASGRVGCSFELLREAFKFSNELEAILFRKLSRKNLFRKFL